MSSVPYPRLFTLIRQEDISGASGTGLVAQGVWFPSGRCVMEWLPGPAGARSLGVYDSPEALLAIHGHQGRTTLHWLAASPRIRLRAPKESLA